MDTLIACVFGHGLITHLANILDSLDHTFGHVILTGIAGAIPEEIVLALLTSTCSVGENTVGNHSHTSSIGVD